MKLSRDDKDKYNCFVFWNTNMAKKNLYSELWQKLCLKLLISTLVVNVPSVMNKYWLNFLKFPRSWLLTHRSHCIFPLNHPLPLTVNWYTGIQVGFPIAIPLPEVAQLFWVYRIRNCAQVKSICVGNPRYTGN